MALCLVAAAGCRRTNGHGRTGDSESAPGPTSEPEQGVAAASPDPTEQRDAPAYPRAEKDLADFDAEVARMKASFRPDPKATPEARVRAELAHMVEVDQYLRHQVDLPFRRGYDEAERGYFQAVLMPRWTEIDQADTARVKELIDEYGWLTISRFGPDADANAWLLVQHADLDVAFQKRVLELLEPLVAKGETSPSNFAYLYDRVALAEDRPQRYGTQGRCVGPGKWEPVEIEDAGKVDARRASVGLGTLEKYKQSFADICH